MVPSSGTIIVPAAAPAQPPIRHPHAMHNNTVIAPALSRGRFDRGPGTSTGMRRGRTTRAHEGVAIDRSGRAYQWRVPDDARTAAAGAVADVATGG